MVMVGGGTGWKSPEADPGSSTAPLSEEIDQQSVELGTPVPEDADTAIEDDTLSRVHESSSYNESERPDVQSPTPPTTNQGTVTAGTVHCLEDPSFDLKKLNEETVPGPQVLETPMPVYLPIGSEGGGPYHVLEAEESSAKPIVSPSSGRSLATDVLEKARSRFDQFWGKGKQDSTEKEGKV